MDSESGSKAAPVGAGVKQFGSRWGIKGTSEVSDGLSAVYKFETRIGEGAQTTAQIYAGLSGGFGTVSMGKMFTAGDNHVGFVDNSGFLGSEAGLIDAFAGSTVSYASPSIGGFSFQVDAQGDQSGAQDKDVDSAAFGATMQLGESGKIGMAYVDRATKGKDTPLAKKDPGHYDKNGKLCADPTAAGCTYSAGNAADGTAHLDDDRTAMIAGQYKLGGMALHLGYGQRKWDTDSTAGKWDEDNSKYAKGLIGEALLDKKQKTTFFGVGGGIGDTGVSFFLQVKDTKTDSNKVTSSYRDKVATNITGNATPANSKFFDSKSVSVGVLTSGVYTVTATDPDGNTGSATPASHSTALKKIADDAGLDTRRGSGTDEFVVLAPGYKWAAGDNAITGDKDTDTKHNDRGSAKSSEKNTPFTIGISRSLGGGASIHLEHDNTDDDASHNQTALILKVDF